MIVDYDKNLVGCHLCWDDKHGCYLYKKIPVIFCSKVHSNKNTTSFYLPDEVIDERNELIKRKHIPEFRIDNDNDPVKFFKYD